MYTRYLAWTWMCMCVYVCVCMYVCVSVGVCMCVCMYVFVCICMYVCMFVFVWVYVCAYVCMYVWKEGRKCFYLTTHSTHFICGYMASDIWLRTILIVKRETRCRHIGYSFRLTTRVILYASSHRQDSTYHGLCYTSREALAGTRNSSMCPPWRIDPTTHRTMSERSYHGACMYVFVCICMYVCAYVCMYIM